MDSMALPPLSEPALPACSAGEVRRVDPSVAALLPISSSLPGAEAVVSDIGPSSIQMAFCRADCQDKILFQYTHECYNLINELSILCHYCWQDQISFAERQMLKHSINAAFLFNFHPL